MSRFILWFITVVGNSILAIDSALKAEAEICRNSFEDPSCTSLLQVVAKPTRMSSKTVLIVEDENMTHLLPSVRSVLKHTPPDWTFTLVHPQYDHMHQPLKLSSMDAFEKLLNSSGRSLTILPFDFQIRQDSQKTIYKDYSDLMKNLSFLERIPAEHFLVIQHDTVMCSDGIEDFLDYDYVGAPWSHYVFPDFQTRVGNGGFSLRSRSFMEWCATNYKKHLDDPEDAFFSNCAFDEHGRIPSVDAASRFAMESIYHPAPIAIHKLMWHSLKGTTNRSKDDLLQEICAWCPAISEVDLHVPVSCNTAS